MIKMKKEMERQKAIIRSYLKHINTWMQLSTLEGGDTP